MSAVLKIVSIMHGKSYKNELRTILVLRDTVLSRILNISNNIKVQLLNRLRGNYFAMQLDKSTVVAH